MISGVTATAFGGEIREALAASLTEPVRWIDVLYRLERIGVKRFVDVGPGGVLAGLVKATLPEATVTSGWADVPLRAG